MRDLREWFESLQLGDTAVLLGTRILAFAAILVLAFIAHAIVRRILLKGIVFLVRKSKTHWDDALVRRNFFKRLAHFAPALVIYFTAPLVFKGYATAIHLLRQVAEIYMILVGLLVIDAFLNVLHDIYQTFDFAHRLPIRGFLQVAKLIVVIFAGIIIISMLVGESPMILLGSFSAMTAVLLLIFKDAILGFVAGIQLSANDMVRIGDWIEMPDYGADGDVIDVTLTTVKVQNFDKTITTIPAYSLISDSFRNWRGMKESGGRRIKRAVYIDMTSIRFCTPEMLEKFKKYKFITEYIERKQKELKEWNEKMGIDNTVLVNGRRLTNIGTFRAYLIEYLRHHPMIHQEMTFLVRHLQPTDRGLPIQVYVFSKDNVWANYEAIQADIFDHILAVIPHFDLRVFQNPTGADFRAVGKTIGS